MISDRILSSVYKQSVSITPSLCIYTYMYTFVFVKEKRLYGCYNILRFFNVKCFCLMVLGNTLIQVKYIYSLLGTTSGRNT